MTLTVHSAFLPHLDPEASLAFYRDLLGFEVRADVRHDGLRWITIGPAGRPGTAIVLEPPAAELGVTAPERRTVAEMMAKGTYAAVVLAADDLDAVFARLRDAGAELVTAPQSDGRPRECAFRDPAGNLVRIVQHHP